MKFLVDADVLSESTKPSPHNTVVDWLLQNEAELAISPITLGEIEYGILLLPSSRRRTRLQAWFSEGPKQLAMVDFDALVASAWAELLARMKKAGIAMPIKDSLIAATAIAHELTVATRNIGDFKNAGVELFNPFKG